MLEQSALVPSDLALLSWALCKELMVHAPRRLAPLSIIRKVVLGQVQQCWILCREQFQKVTFDLAFLSWALYQELMVHAQV